MILIQSCIEHHRHEPFLLSTLPSTLKYTSRSFIQSPRTCPSPISVYTPSSQTLTSSAFDESMRPTKRSLRPSVLASRTSEYTSPSRFPLPASIASILHLPLHFATFPYNHDVYKWYECNEK